MQTARKKVGVLLSINAINDNTDCKVLALMNIRIKLMSIKTKNFSAKLLSPEEFQKNESIKNGNIATALRKLLPLAKSEDDYLPLIHLLEKNMKNLANFASNKFDPQSVLRNFNEIKEKTNIANCRTLKEEFLKEEKRLADNYPNGFLNLNMPNLLVLEQIRNMNAFNNANNEFYFLTGLIDLENKYDVRNLLVSYRTRGVDIPIRDFETLIQNTIAIKNGESVVNGINLFIEKQKIEKDFFFYIVKKYNMPIAFQLKNSGIENQLLLVREGNKNIFENLNMNEEIKRAKIEKLVTIVKENELTNAIYSMIKSIKNKIANEEKTKDATDEQKIKEIMDSFFNKIK